MIKMGIPISPDCDDSNPAIIPVATETCNGADNNCCGKVKKILVCDNGY